MIADSTEKQTGSAVASAASRRRLGSIQMIADAPPLRVATDDSTTPTSHQNPARSTFPRDFDSSSYWRLIPQAR